MTIILEPYSIPERGRIELNINRSFEIRVTAEEARRLVNRWLHHEVSYLIGADTPTLVVGEQVVWRVPAWIGFPDVGRVGLVGTVEVDVDTGAMNNTSKRKAEIERRAEELATRLPPYQPKGEVPAEYVAKNVPPAPKLILHDDAPPEVMASPTTKTL